MTCTVAVRVMIFRQADGDGISDREARKRATPRTMGARHRHGSEAQPAPPAN
jgi:hypothetical protein